MPPLTTSPEPDYTLAPDVILLPAPDGTARLLDLGGQFYALPAVGAELLTDTLERGSAAAVRLTAERYGVEPRRVTDDLDEFLSRLEREGLVRRRLSRREPGRLTTALARVTLTPALVFIHRALRGTQSRAAALLALARLSFRLFGWSRTVRVWRRCHPPNTAPLSDAEGAEAAATIDEAVRRAAARHPITVECKERSLCCWALARRAGIPAALVVGISLFPLAGHCWCESGGRTLGDDRDRCEAYTPVARYE